MKNKIIPGLIVSLVVLTFSCRKDPMVNPDYACSDLHYNPNWPNVSYVQLDTVMSLGRFNPNDQNELCCLFAVRSLGLYQIRKYSLSSHTNAVAYSGLVWSFKSYGSNGWLLFNVGNNIWKVKTNGDSLAQLTFDYSSLEPCWNGTGDRYIFRRDTSSISYSIICDKNGQHLDTIPDFYWHNGVWSRNDDVLVSIAFDQLKVYSFSSGSISIIPGHGNNDPSKDGILDVALSPDGHKVYWCNGWGIFYQNLQTGQTGEIHTSCDARRFISIDVSADGQILLCTAYNQRMLDNNINQVYIESRLYTMKTDGSGLTEIYF